MPSVDPSGCSVHWCPPCSFLGDPPAWTAAPGPQASTWVQAIGSLGRGWREESAVGMLTCLLLCNNGPCPRLSWPGCLLPPLDLPGLRVAAALRHPPGPAWLSAPSCARPHTPDTPQKLFFYPTLLTRIPCVPSLLYSDIAAPPRKRRTLFLSP